MSYNHTRVYGEKSAAILRFININATMHNFVCFNEQHRQFFPAHRNSIKGYVFTHLEADDELTASRNSSWDWIPYSNIAISRRLAWPIEHLKKEFADDEPFYICEVDAEPTTVSYEYLKKTLDDFYSYDIKSNYYLAQPDRFIYFKKPVPITINDFLDFKKELAHPTLKNQPDPIKAALKNMVIGKVVEQCHRLGSMGFVDAEIAKELLAEWKNGTNETLEEMKREESEYHNLVHLVCDWRHFHFKDR